VLLFHLSLHSHTLLTRVKSYKQEGLKRNSCPFVVLPRMNTILFALCIGITIAQNPEAFVADVQIYNDKVRDYLIFLFFLTYMFRLLMSLQGALTARMYYDYPNKSLRIDYTIGIKEIIDFDSVSCTSSFVATFTLAQYSVTANTQCRRHGILEILAPVKQKF
jgi:hypothetical protein